MSSIKLTVALVLAIAGLGSGAHLFAKSQVPGAQGQPGGPGSGPPPNPPNGLTPSPGLQAEMVAHLHSFIGDYRKLGAGPPFQPSGTPSSPNKPPEPGGTRIPGTPVRVDVGKGAKEVKVYGLSLVGADSQYLYVKLKLRIREKNLGVVLYTSEGTAKGKFRLAEVTPDRLSLYSPIDLPVADVTVSDLDLPHIGNADERDGAKRAIRASFPKGIWAPLYPTLTTGDAFGEELILRAGKPAPVPNAIEFKVRTSNNSARTVSFRVTTVDGSAKAGVDYSAVNRVVIIPSMSREATFRVGLLRRDGHQGVRTFQVRLSPITNGLPASLSATGRVLDYAGE